VPLKRDGEDFNHLSLLSPSRGEEVAESRVKGAATASQPGRKAASSLIVRSHINPDTSHMLPQKVAAAVANDVGQIYAKRSRAQKLTGEWIVFAKHEGKNYYLTLAAHGEGDDHIFARIRDGCVSEFPFLSSLLHQG
jgi:hypothetical protein